MILRSRPSRVLGLALLAVAAMALVFLINSSSVMAQTAESDTTQEDPCANSQDDHELRSCREAEFQAAKAELLALTLDLRRSLSDGLDGNAAALDQAQSDWERYVNSDCNLINFESLSGTAGDIYLTYCLTEAYRKRTTLIKELLDSP